MKSLFITLAVVAIGLFPTRTQAQQNPGDGLSQQQVAAIQETTEAFRENQKVPGLSLAILQEGQVVMARGFGMANLEHQVAVTPVTRFRTASIAKPITATLLMTLVSEGKLDLHRSVQAYCPGYPEKQWPVTVQQVMGHLGGVRHYKSAAEASSTRHFFTLDKALETFAEDPLLHEPGTRYLYSSFGYNLLGSVAEGAGDADFMTLLQEKVLGPMGMENTVQDDTFAIVPHRSAGYALGARLPGSQNLEKDQVYHSTLHDTSMKIPGGGLLSTPTDLVRFADALLNDQLFEANLRQRMWTGQHTADGKATGYGLGWRVGRLDGENAIWHTGGQSGTSTVLVIYPEKKTSIAVMCNLQGTNVTALVLQIARQLNQQ